MPIICPNRNLPEWKRLVDEFGEDHAHLAFFRHGSTDIPSVDQARQALKDRRFDFALLDLHLPVATKGALGAEAIAKNLGQEIPYGFFLLLEACKSGADAAVVTDLNHHQDPFSAAFDYYSSELFTINGKRALLLHARMVGGVKDWDAASGDGL